MSCGTTKLKALVLDAQAVIIRASQNTSRMLAGVDKAIAVDLTDDVCWKAADDALGLVDEFIQSGRVVDAQAELNKCRQQLRMGMNIDFSDISKEKLKALILPELESFEHLEERAKGLTESINGKG